MPKSEDLHGNAPDKSRVALLLIDMISDKTDNKHALKYLERVLKANTQSSTEIDFDKLKSET